MAAQIRAKSAQAFHTEGAPLWFGCALLTIVGNERCKSDRERSTEAWRGTA